MSPPCEQYVPGYGDANANFHVIGDHPGIHGGLDAEIPFTGNAWSETFFDALRRGGLVESVGESETELSVAGTFLSYLHMCLSATDDPSDDEYAAMERFFDAELRAITAHVLLPVGARATAHVLGNYTAEIVPDELDMDTYHATEVHGSGWLVVPIKDPAEWTDTDGETLVRGLTELRRTDYRRETDLGRFLPGEDPYLVR